MARILTHEEVVDALSRVSRVDGDRAGPDRVSYGALSADDFELLLYELYQHRQGPSSGYDNVRLMITGADQGRDVWLTQEELPVGLVQCKRVMPGFSAPDAIREVIKFLLFAELEPKLLPEPEKFCFTLAVSADPAGTTTSFFHTPKTWLADNEDKISGYVKVVQAKYTSFSSDIATVARTHSRASHGDL